MEKFYQNAKPEKYSELSKDIIGIGVEFPLNFMVDQDLKFRINEKEFYAPDYNFT